MCLHITVTKTKLMLCDSDRNLRFHVAPKDRNNWFMGDVVSQQCVCTGVPMLNYLGRSDIHSGKTHQVD